jgi:hypothetical protein
MLQTMPLKQTSLSDGCARNERVWSSAHTLRSRRWNFVVRLAVAAVRIRPLHMRHQ